MKRLLPLLFTILFIQAQAIVPTAYTKGQLKQMMQLASTPADIANTPDSIWENATIATFRAMEEMPWSKNVPQREFEHFVLPLRINNEPIDNHRPIIYAELADRVRNMNMKDAILEANHWCHEYVVYQPSDSRTHSPLQSMSSCIGRCGEESTFTVAALRSIGIPARQVYTPRWAHTDDNHAWVEAWADGQWYFIGACEPEPKLNMAWFNAPATRAMMMHTYVRGQYSGPEEVVEILPDGVTINVTPTYAPVAKNTVKVTDKNGTPAKDAKVTFRVYNYAEFYPVATRSTDDNGIATLTSGKGDMLIWATDGKLFGFAKTSAGKDDLVEIQLSHNASDLANATYDYDIIPPVQGSNIVEATEAEKAINAKKLFFEDSLRNCRLAKFMTADEAAHFAKELGLDSDRVKSVMKDARGNHATISSFLKETPSTDRERALRLIESLSEKDRSDVTAEVLHDHITTPPDTGDFYNSYILSPRIEAEGLSPWRQPLTRKLQPIAETMRQNPDLWAKWLKDSITIIPDWRPAAVSMYPEIAMEISQTNVRSRNMLFVAGARSMGIPARINPVTGATQWADATQQWHNVAWESTTNVTNNNCQGKLALVLDEGNTIADPAYYTHFTISKIHEGEPHLLEFGETDTYATAFSSPIALDCGVYLLTTGQRLADGGVLVHNVFFEILENVTTEVPLTIRHDDTTVSVIGNFNSENRYMALTPDSPASLSQKSLLETTGRGYYVLCILGPGQEPTNHVLKDISAVSDGIEATAMPMVMLLAQGSNPEKFFSDPLLPSLPSQASYGIDQEGELASELIANLSLSDKSLPIIVIADTFNRVVYASQGYSIGIGQRLIDTINKLR